MSQTNVNGKLIQNYSRDGLKSENSLFKHYNYSSNLISVNYHLTRACNYACKFCFARFNQTRSQLPVLKAKKLINQLFCHGTKKITFVGGEPLLYPALGDLLIYSKELGLTTSIISNGSLITPIFLQNFHPFIDWIGLSIESGKEEIECSLGRHMKSNPALGCHVQHIRSLVPQIQSYGIKIKMNSVITRINFQEDLHWLIEELHPKRWKVFQVLPIHGENDEDVKPFLISQSEFEYFCEKHKDLYPICENNELMIGSYIMIDPLGRFFDNTSGTLTFSEPILDLGVIDAFKEISFCKNRFSSRGGLYNW